MPSRGATLVETIFVAAIIGLVVSILFSLYPSSLFTVRRSEHRLRAAELASSILDAKRSLPFASLRALPRNVLADEASPPAGGDGVVLVPRFMVADVPDADPARLLALRVQVDWVENRRPQQLVQELLVCDLPK